MIDNPLPNQVMQEMDAIQKAADFEDYCKNHAIEIAKHYKVHDELHDDFAEWYHDYMSQNSESFDHTCIYLDSDYIVDWWEAESYLFDDFDSPYMEITKWKIYLILRFVLTATYPAILVRVDLLTDTQSTMMM